MFISLFHPPPTDASLYPLGLVLVAISSPLTTAGTYPAYKDAWCGNEGRRLRYTPAALPFAQRCRLSDT